MKKRKDKFRYLRNYIRNHKIKDGFMKRGIYGSLFDDPKKVKKALKEAKNENHKNYMIRTFLKIANKAGSKQVLFYLSQL